MKKEKWKIEGEGREENYISTVNMLWGSGGIVPKNFGSFSVEDGVLVVGLCV
jgi:hypothetical protein